MLRCFCEMHLTHLRRVIKFKNMLTAPGRWLIETHDRLRLWKDGIFRPLTDALPPRLTPNHVTWFRTALTFAWLPVALSAPALWQIAVYALIYFLDLMDGALARFRDRVTPFGSMLDHVSDKFANVAVLLAMYGATHYVWRELELFLVWDMVTAALIAVETWSGWQPLIRVRALAEFAVKTGLWIFLITRVFLTSLSAAGTLPFWA